MNTPPTADEVTIELAKAKAAYEVWGEEYERFNSSIPVAIFIDTLRWVLGETKQSPLEDILL